MISELVIRRPQISEYDSVQALIETVSNETFKDLFAPNPVPLKFKGEDWPLAWVAVSVEKIVGVIITNQEWVDDLWVLREARRQNKYRSTVLTAFENVADTLHALEQDADALKAAAASRDAAKVTLDLTTQQMRVGYVNYLALLSAEQSYQQALINLVQAQSNRYADTAALFQALGGGWWNRPDVPKS
jgi:hypothetical protein